LTFTPENHGPTKTKPRLLNRSGLQEALPALRQFSLPLSQAEEFAAE
jgi:hypothetical protein